ncbi:MAG: hypothetical protein WCN98_13975, partial [Verrucomicrobiaceae bacterium]
MPKSSRPMWEAALRACAAIVRAGFTAADDGKNEASITNRLRWSQLRQKGSSTEVWGSVPNRAVPHW